MKTSPIKIRKAVAAIFNALEIPDNRTRENQCRYHLREINQAAKVGKTLAKDQLDWLTDAIRDKHNEMYPSRFEDLSTPVLAAELAQLERQKEQITALLGLVEQLAIETEVRLPKPTLYESDDRYQGM